MNHNITFLLFSLFSLAAYAQPVEYARCIIDSLCKPEMHGRGYVNKGDKRAAEFIVSEFKQQGIGSMDGEFYQPFNISVNQTVGRLLISVDGKTLNPGKDYTENPLVPLSAIKFLLNFDLAGTGDEGIKVVNGSVYKDAFNQLKTLNDSHAIASIGKFKGNGLQ